MIDMLPPPDAPSEDGIRELTDAEIKTLEPIFASFHQPLPDPVISRFVGAVQDGKVIAFIVLQLRLHAEPMWIADGHSAVFTALAKKAEEVILERVGPQVVYLFAPAGRVSRLAQLMGMSLEPWNVLSKVVMPDSPIKTTPVLDEEVDDELRPN